MIEEIPQCDFCNRKTQCELIFPCRHKMCTSCLYKIIITLHIQDLQDKESIQLTCKCRGVLSLSLEMVYKVIKNAKENKTQFYEKTQEKCTKHVDAKLDIYCITCGVKICCYCTLNGALHHDHNYQLIRDYGQLLAEKLLQFPNSKYMKLDEIAKKLHQDFQEVYLPTTRKMDEIIQSLSKFKEEYDDIMKRQFQRADLALKILTTIYDKFYSDISQPTSDLDELLFYNQVKLYIPDIKISQRSLSKEIQQITNIIQTMNQHEHIILTMNEISFGSFSFSQSLPGHQDSISSFIQLKDNRFVSGSNDKTIRIWAETQNIFYCSQVLTGHNSGVMTLLELRDGRVASGSRITENSIFIWSEIEKEKESSITPSKVEKGFFITQKLKGHSESVCSLIELSDGRLVSGSADASIRIWREIDRLFKCIHILGGHESWVLCLALLNDGRIVSGSADRTIKIWNEKEDHSFEVSQTLTGHKEYIMCIKQLANGRIASGSMDSSIKIWSEDNSMFQCSQTLLNHFKSVNALEILKDGRIVSASDDRSIKFWIEAHKGFMCIDTLNNNKNAINAVLVMSDGRIISGSANNRIKIWVETKMSQNKASNESNSNCLIF